MEIKEEDEVMKNDQSTTVKTDPEIGRLVMTVNGEQKQLSFCRNDLLSTATMLDGDKVRGEDG